MGCLSGFIGFTSFLTLLYSLVNLVCLCFLIYVQQYWVITDYLKLDVRFQLFLSQYFYDPKKDLTSTFPPPIHLKCNLDQVTNAEEDAYHSWTGSEHTFAFLIFFLLLNLLWAIASMLVIGENCLSKNKKFTITWIWVFCISLVFHLIASIIYCMEIAYPLSLVQCLDPNSDLFLNLLSSELIFPVFYSGGFIAWIFFAISWFVILLCLLLNKSSKKGEAPSREIIYAHGPPAVGASPPSQNPNDISMYPMGHANIGFVNNEVRQNDGMESQRNSNDIYSRRSSRVMVSRNIQVEGPQSQSPMFVEQNHVLLSKFPLHVGTQTANEVGTQTAKEHSTKIIYDHKSSKNDELIFTRSKIKLDSHPQPNRGSQVNYQYPPKPPPLPLPNMRESSPDQPWNLITRNEGKNSI